MPVPQLWNGTTYLIPQSGEVGWDGQMTAWILDVSANAVNTSLAQTLANKTLTSPTINTPTIATPTITGAVVVGSPTGGALTAGSINAQALYVNNVAVLSGNQTITISGDASGSGATAITLTLPTVNSNVGTFTAVTLNAKGQTTAGTNLALTGDVTGTASGSSLATSLAALSVTTAKLNTAAVTYAKVQNVATVSLLGNPTGAPAAPSEITLGSTLAFSGSALQTAALTGDVTASANSFATTLATVNSNVGTFTAVTVNGKGLTTAATNLALTGDVTGTASGSSLATTLASLAVTTAKINTAAVTYAKIQNVATVSLLGNPTGSPAAPSEITLGSSLGFTGTTLAVATDVVLPGSGAVTVPAGNTAAQPGSPTNGMMRYNSQTGTFEFRQAGSWVTFGTSTGTVTSVATGSGLSGGPISVSGTISADFSVLQAVHGGPRSLIMIERGIRNSRYMSQSLLT